VLLDIFKFPFRFHITKFQSISNSLKNIRWPSLGRYTLIVQIFARIYFSELKKNAFREDLISRIWAKFAKFANICTLKVVNFLLGSNLFFGVDNKSNCWTAKMLLFIFSCFISKTKELSTTGYLPYIHSSSSI